MNSFCKLKSGSSKCKSDGNPAKKHHISRNVTYPIKSVDQNGLFYHLWFYMFHHAFN